MSRVAIITARGGSKRIPQKNIKLFCGEPIISYSIKAAIESDCFDEIMVSTDDEEIASVSRRFGASVPFMRTEKNSDDFATTADVVEEVILKYKSIGVFFDSYMCIYPTAPFVTPQKIIDAFQQWQMCGAEALVSVVSFDYPPQRGLVINEGVLEYKYPEFAGCRSQDLERVYHDCGQFYIGMCETMITTHSMIPPNTIPFILDQNEVQDIDTDSDWRVAETKYKALFCN